MVTCPLTVTVDSMGTSHYILAKVIPGRAAFEAAYNRGENRVEWGIDEKAVAGIASVRICAASVRAGSAAAGIGGPAVHDGVLLQDTVGASAGVFESVFAVPLPAAAADREDGADSLGED